MKFDIRDLVILMLLIAVGISAFILTVKIGDEGTQCTLDPLVYGAKKLAATNPHEILCQCNMLADTPSETLYFDKNGSWKEAPANAPSFIHIDNFSWLDWEDIKIE